MAVNVRIPTTMRPISGGASSVQVEGVRRSADVLANLDARASRVPRAAVRRRRRAAQVRQRVRRRRRRALPRGLTRRCPTARPSASSPPSPAAERVLVRSEGARIAAGPFVVFSSRSDWLVRTRSPPCLRRRPCRRRRVLLGLVGDDGLGGEEQGRDRGCVLQRRAGDLGSVDDAELDQILVDAGGGVEALGCRSGS